jgi:ABC-type uncharacterized transport system ATPase subunit
MIQVEHLTKRYSGFTAVRDISFHVAKGEVVGFLGPNGAGKSTTMRMITGYLPPTSGRASIAGFDIFTDSIQARQQLGYLPESTPLYHDMRVNEYLRYRASLKGVASSKLRERVGDGLAEGHIDERRADISPARAEHDETHLSVTRPPVVLDLDDDEAGAGDGDQEREERAGRRRVEQVGTVDGEHEALVALGHAEAFVHLHARHPAEPVGLDNAAGEGSLGLGHDAPCARLTATMT